MHNKLLVAVEDHDEQVAEDKASKERAFGGVVKETQTP
jgi:hypothetical protein